MDLTHPWRLDVYPKEGCRGTTITLFYEKKTTAADMMCGLRKAMSEAHLGGADKPSTMLVDDLGTHTFIITAEYVSARLTDIRRQMENDARSEVVHMEVAHSVQGEAIAQSQREFKEESGAFRPSQGKH